MATDATGTKTKRTAKPKGDATAPAAGTAAPESTSIPATSTDLPVDSTAAAAATPATPATQGNLVDQLDIDELFPADGSFPKRGVFRFNTIYGPAIALRRAILVKIAKTPHAKINSMSRPARNTMFSLIKSERGRYYGTALRAMDNAETGTKKGEPLPQLVFLDGKDGAVSKTIAAGYGRAIKWAGDNMRAAVFPKAPAAQAEPVAVAA